MKREKWFLALWGFVLAFVISSAAVLCVITGFDMAVAPSRILLWCGLAAFGSVVCFALPLGLLPFGTVAAAGIASWFFGGMEMSFRAVLYRLTRKYSAAFGWPLLRPEHYTSDMLEPLLGPFLCLAGAVIAVWIAWALCRRKTALPGLILAAVTAGASFLVRETAPDRLWVWLLLFGFLLLVLTHGVRRKDLTQGNRLTFMAAIPLAMILLLLFAVTPQSHYRADVFARNTVNALLESRFVKAIFGDLTAGYFEPANSGVVRLDNVGARTEEKEEILQVLTDYTGKLYLRSRAMDTYDGLSWTDSGTGNAGLSWPDSQVLQRVGEVRISTRFAHKMLYLPYYVQSVDTANVALGLENTAKLTEYSFTTALPPIDGQIAALEKGQLDGTAYRHYPKSVAKWAEPMAQKITEGKTSVYAKAQAIGDHVRRAARYDLNTETMPYGSSDFAKWFLKECDTGYCVHFASAAAVLLQAAGIPARYVSGYMLEVEAGTVTIVRSSDAHAWVEYWLPGFGWTILEATPSAQTENTLPETTDTPFAWKEAGLVLLILLAVAILAVFVQRRVRLFLRQRKLQSGTTKERILACWQEALRLAVCLQEKPGEELHAIAEKAKFSQHPPREEDLQAFQVYLQAAKQRLRCHSFFKKLYYRFVLALY